MNTLKVKCAGQSKEPYSVYVTLIFWDFRIINFPELFPFSLRAREKSRSLNDVL